MRTPQKTKIPNFSLVAKCELFCLPSHSTILFSLFQKIWTFVFWYWLCVVYKVRRVTVMTHLVQPNAASSRDLQKLFRLQNWEKLKLQQASLRILLDEREKQTPTEQMTTICEPPKIGNSSKFKSWSRYQNTGSWSIRVGLCTIIQIQIHSWLDEYYWWSLGISLGTEYLTRNFLELVLELWFRQSLYAVKYGQS